MKHLPEQEQLNALAKYENEYASLSEPEQFGVVVSALTLGSVAEWCVSVQPETGETVRSVLGGYTPKTARLFALRFSVCSSPGSTAPSVVWFTVKHFAFFTIKLGHP